MTSSAPVEAPRRRAALDSDSAEIEISVQQPVPTAPALPKRSGPPFEQVYPTNGSRPAPSPFAAYASSVPRAPEGPMVPHPRDVLDALALSGVFEPPAEHAGAMAAWANADRGPKRKGAPTLIVGMVLFLAAGAGISSSIATSARSSTCKPTPCWRRWRAISTPANRARCRTSRKSSPAHSSWSRAAPAERWTGRGSARWSAW